MPCLLTIHVIQRIDAEDGDLKIYGLFRHGIKKHAKSKALIVLIHGTGDNALYFDNKFFSSVTDFPFSLQLLTHQLEFLGISVRLVMMY